MSAIERKRPAQHDPVIAKRQRRQSEPLCGLLDLPIELLNEIINRLAEQDWHSVIELSFTCRSLNAICKDFMRKHPIENYIHDSESEHDSDESCVCFDCNCVSHKYPTNVYCEESDCEECLEGEGEGHNAPCDYCKNCKCRREDYDYD